MNRRGFTLIELLVVIAIIGILSAVVLTSLTSARVKARDARRQSDLHQISVALELYNNTHGAYPAGSAGSDRGCWRTQSTADLVCNPLGALLVDGIIQFVPYDPGTNYYVGTGCGGAQFYAYWSDGQTYLLGAVNEAQGSTGCVETGNWGGPTATNYTYQHYVKEGL